jgi:membrane protein DedA with SNARE-associated domain
MFRKTFIALILLFICLSFSEIKAQENDSMKCLNKTKVTTIQKVEKWYDAHTNYTTITILMTIESSFVPLPSEIIIPPAAYIASKPDSKLNIYLVVFFGVLGSLLGALINYFLSSWLGRMIIYKFADSKLGHLFLLNSDKIKNAEAYFNERGKVSTFIGRLIPGVRHLISIPAGLAKMNLFSFCLYTVLGATVWNIVLAFVGYFAQGQMDMILKYSHELSILFLVVGGLFLVYVILRKSKKAKK